MAELVLSDSVLIGFARNPHLRSNTSELKYLYNALVKGGGGCRCRKKRGSLGAALASLKYAVANSPGLAAKIKAHAKVQKLVVHVKVGNKLVRRTV